MSSFPPSATTDPSLPHDSLVSHVIGICSAMMALVTLVIVARFWVRFKLVKGRFGADDWCILLSWILAIAYDLDPLNRKCLELRNFEILLWIGVLYVSSHDVDFFQSPVRHAD